MSSVQVIDSGVSRAHSKMGSKFTLAQMSQTGCTVAAERQAGEEL